MAHPGRQEILVVPGMAQQEHAHIVDEVWVRADVEIKIAPHAAAGIDAHRAGEAFGHMPRLFHRLPSDLKKLAVLRVEDGGVFWRKAKELRIEHVIAGHIGGDGHIVWPGHPLGALSGGAQLCRLAALERAHPVAQVRPIGVYPFGARHRHRHADDRDVTARKSVVRAIHCDTCPTARLARVRHP